LTGQFLSLQDGAAEPTAIKFSGETNYVRFIPKAELQRRGYDLTKTGKPAVYYDELFDETTGKYKIGFYPQVSGTSYNMEIVERRQTKIYVATDVCFLPQKWVSVLKSYVRMRFQIRAGSLQK